MNIERPILINNDTGINPDSNLSLIHNINKINTFNVRKFNDEFNPLLSGIEFASIPNSKTELKFNDIEYKFSKLIITNDFDSYDTVGFDPSYALIMEFNKVVNSNDKLYITIPINDNISSNETLNYIIGYLDDTNVINDISNGNNIICNIPNSNLNEIIPNTEYIFYSIEKSGIIHNHIVIDTTNSTLSIDYNSINDILFGNNSDKVEPTSTSDIYKIQIPIKNDEMLKIDQLDDIYIDCSPIEGNDHKIVKEKVLKIETAPILKKTGSFIFSLLALLLFFIILFFIFSNIGYLLKSVSGILGLASNATMSTMSSKNMITNLITFNLFNNMVIIFIFSFMLYLYFDSFIRIKKLDNIGMKISLFIISILLSIFFIVLQYNNNIQDNSILSSKYLYISLGLSLLVIGFYTIYFNFIISSFNVNESKKASYKMNYFFTIILILLLIFNVSSTESSVNFLQSVFN